MACCRSCHLGFRAVAIRTMTRFCSLRARRSGCARIARQGSVEAGPEGAEVRVQIYDVPKMVAVLGSAPSVMTSKHAARLIELMKFRSSSFELTCNRPASPVAPDGVVCSPARLVRRTETSRDRGDVLTSRKVLQFHRGVLEHRFADHYRVSVVPAKNFHRRRRGEPAGQHLRMRAQRTPEPHGLPSGKCCRHARRRLRLNDEHSARSTHERSQTFRKRRRQATNAGLHKEVRGPVV